MRIGGMELRDWNGFFKIEFMSCIRGIRKFDRRRIFWVWEMTKEIGIISWNERKVE